MTGGIRRGREHSPSPRRTPGEALKRARSTLPRLKRRLNLVFRAPDAEEDVPPTSPVAGEPRDVEFVAYAEDCVLSGHVKLAADRLTDLLNRHDELLLVDVLVESLGDNRSIEVKNLLMARDELLIVHATGPRGDPGRRQRTRQHPIAVQLGPYHIRGYIHTLPGSDPLGSLRRRRAMVPLTEAWIEYTAGGAVQRRRVSAVVINRHLMDWAVEVADEEVEWPELPIAAEKGPLLKDFTGSLLTEPFAETAAGAAAEAIA